MARRLAETFARIVARPRPVLAGIIGAQLLLTLGLVRSSKHNGWLFYQGGDQIWHTTSAWLVAHGELPYAFVGYAWAFLLAPFTWVAGPDFVSLLPPTILLQVLVLGPIVTLCIYRLGVSAGGTALGLWAAALWVVLPFAAIPLFVDRYHDTYVDQVLPQALGLTAMADYPSMAAVLVSAVLVVRSLERHSVDDAVLAGLAAGVASGIKPANFLFLAGPALAYLAARRWRLGTTFALALVPSVLALVVWKHRGLGEVPAFGLGEVHLAASSTPPVGGRYLEKLVPLDWEIFARNMDYLREFFWSNRVVQWIPFAGMLALARRSLPLSGLLGGWLFAYVIVKGSHPSASIERGDFWRLTIPAFPAFVLLFAAIPLLVPGVLDRLRSLGAPVAQRPVGRRWLVAAAAVFAVAPLLVTAFLRPAPFGGREVVVNDILTPVDSGLRVQATREGQGQRLTWSFDVPAKVFYHVFRTRTPGPDAICAGTGAGRCELLMEVIGTTRERSFVDGSPAPGLTYRVGAAANWIDDPAGGDVIAISKTVQAAP